VRDALKFLVIQLCNTFTIGIPPQIAELDKTPKPAVSLAAM